jgi:hypothetical protein
VHSARVIAGGGGEGRPGAWIDNHGHFFDASLGDLFDQDAQGGFGNAIAIYESLEREHLLGFASGGDNSLANVHVGQFNLVRQYQTRKLRSIRQHSIDFVADTGLRIVVGQNISKPGSRR